MRNRGQEVKKVFEESVVFDSVGIAFWKELQNVSYNEKYTIYFIELNSSPVEVNGDYVVNPKVNGVYKITSEYANSLTTEHSFIQDGLDWTHEQCNNYFDNALNKPDGFLYYSSDETILVYGSTLKSKNKTYYLMMSSYVAPIESTVSVLRSQLVYSIALVLLLSVGAAYLLSRKISKPLSDFAAISNRFGNGEFDVKFPSSNIEEVDDLSRALNFATEELSKTEDMRREFMANVSHDLRTPLTMIRAYAEMIRDISGRNDVKRTQHAQTIIDETDRLAGLVAEIQLLSKLQAGTIEMETADFDAGATVDTVVNRFGIMHEKFAFTFVRDIEKGLTVRGDQAKIEQVMYNLIGNAVNYAGEDKIVKISAHAVNGWAHIEIADNGKGISEEDLKTIWDRYYRCNEVKRTVVGSGLGLSIVKNILEKHNTPYGVRSKLGEGTVFWFDLKLVDEQK